jgi:hypothetical protein
MKFIVILISAFAMTFAHGQSTNKDFDLVCAYRAAQYYKDIVKFKNFARDKYRHCTVSCAIGIDCGVTSSAIVGMAKEIYDVFGPGNAEWADLMANLMGLRISRRVSVGNVKQCSKACQEFYPIGKVVKVNNLF